MNRPLIESREGTAPDRPSAVARGCGAERQLLPKPDVGLRAKADVSDGPSSSSGGEGTPATACSVGANGHYRSRQREYKGDSKLTSGVWAPAATSAISRCRRTQTVGHEQAAAAARRRTGSRRSATPDLDRRTTADAESHPPDSPSAAGRPNPSESFNDDLRHALPSGIRSWSATRCEGTSPFSAGAEPEESSSCRRPRPRPRRQFLVDSTLLRSRRSARRRVRLRSACHLGT